MKRIWGPALRIALVYLLLGVAWIWLSDRIQPGWAQTPDGMLWFQTLKGFAYVAITALLLYVLIYRQMNKQDLLIRLLRKRNRLLQFALVKFGGLRVLLVDAENQVIQGFGQGALWGGKSMARLSGTSLLEWTGEGPLKEELVASLTRARDKRSPLSHKLQLDGKYYRIKIFPMESGSDEGILLLLVEDLTRRVSDRKQRLQLERSLEAQRSKTEDAQSTLRSSRLMFRELLETVSDGVIVWQPGADGKAALIEHINAAALAMLDLRSSELHPETLWDALEVDDPKDLERFVNNDYRVNPECSLSARVKVLAAKGTLILKARYVNNGWRPYIFTILRMQQNEAEVQVRKNYEEMLFQQQNMVDQSNRLKTLFLSNLSHEVRTPMNGILGFVELLEQDEMSEAQRDYLIMIRRSSDNLLKILNALVEVARLENGQVIVEKDWMEPGELMADLEVYLQQKLKECSKDRIAVSVRFDAEEVPGKVYVDRDKLENTLHLILDNAVKFTQEGKIELGLAYEKEGDQLLFWVSDTGIGIKKLSKYQLFQPFMTFNDAEKVLYGGLGLGLSIVKGTMDAMGGDVDVDSEPGKGSRFLLTLPLNMRDERKPDAEERLRKVLVVQYGPDALKEVREQLRRHNTKIYYAHDGAAAIDILFENRDIDLVITDVRLSDMDAYELIKALKRIKPTVAVLAQTPYFVGEEKLRCMNAGFIDYLVKPLDYLGVVRLLNRLS